MIRIAGIFLITWLIYLCIGCPQGNEQANNSKIVTPQNVVGKDIYIVQNNHKKSRIQQVSDGKNTWCEYYDVITLKNTIDGKIIEIEYNSLPLSDYRAKVLLECKRGDIIKVIIREMVKNKDGIILLHQGNIEIKEVT